MLTALVATAALSAAPDADQSGRRLLRAMARKYSSALELTATVTNAVTDGSGALVTVSELAYVKPSRIRLVQSQRSKVGGVYELVSDGKRFVYEVPPETTGGIHTGKRMMEQVKLASGYLLTVSDIYLAGTNSLPDSGPVFPLLVGADTKVDSWFKSFIRVSAPVEGMLDGVAIKKVTGTFRSTQINYENDGVPRLGLGEDGKLKFDSTGRFVRSDSPAEFTFFIGKDGLLVRYMYVESHILNKKDVYIAYVWDVRAEINPSPAVPLSSFSIR